MKYRIEAWTPRGVNVYEASTKREANTIATRLRGDRDVQMTTVVKPNGDVRSCRNPKAAA